MGDSNNSSAAANGRPAASPARPGKSAAAFRTISEVATDLDVAQHVLRFWESKFPQVRPLKRGGGRRYYRPEDVELLRTIRGLLYDEGYTIKGAQKLLKGGRRFPDAEGPHAAEPAAPAPEGGAVRPAPPVAPANAANARAAAGAPGAGAAAARPPAPPAPSSPAPVRDRLEHLRDELVSLREMLRRAAE